MSTEELRPLPVAASRGCCRRPEEGGDPGLRAQAGRRGVGPVPELGDTRRARGWAPAEGELPRVPVPGGWRSPPARARCRFPSLSPEPGGPRRSASFLTEDGSDAGPLSSTRRSLLEGPELGGGCALGDPLLWWGCPPEPPSLASPRLAPRPRADPGSSALPPQPLASSTLLWAGDELGGEPRSRAVGGRTGGPPWGLPEPRDSASPEPQWEFGPGGSLSSPPPQCCGRVWGGHGSPRAPRLRGGLDSCSVACRTPGDRGDIPGTAARHRARVPRGPVVGCAGLGTAAPAAPDLGGTVLGVGGRGRSPGDGSSPRDSSSPGDSSGASERFVSAVETLEPSEAGGCLGTPASSPNAEKPQGEGLWGGSRAAPRREDGSREGGVGGLLVQLQGCSLRGSPPGSPAGLAAGAVTPRGPEHPRHRHVTPRTKSRLRAFAARLSASSSSSLFDETLEMPRRPPRLRAPQGVPRDPATTSGHCVTPWGEDVASGDGEVTGSLGDTEILPKAPNQPSSPPGTSSSPGSSPTVLLVPGDRGHPQGAPLDARGSPSSSPTVLLVPGDHGHPQDSPSDSRGSLRAAGSPNPRVQEGGSAWQDPQPLGTHRSLWPHGSSSHLLAPRPPGSTAVEPGSPATQPLPADHSTREHPEDDERGQAPGEWHSPSTEATTSPGDTAVRDGQACTAPPRPLSDEALRRRLRALGDDPGPITELTRRLYQRRLEELAKGPRARTAGHSPELAAALRSGRVPDCAQDELVLARQFDRPDRSRHWREGLVKSSFNYLLLDPRITQNLPLRSHHLSPAECFRTFVNAIFYVGKGTRARPYCHLAEALSQHRARTPKGCPKVRRILEIWASGQGVVSVLCFQSSVPAEAYTREGCLVEALGLQTITNQRKGRCYGVAASWPAERRRRLGVHMLHRAMRVFLAEGERQLRPADIAGGR